MGPKTGWRKDPACLHRLRYRDGRRWTMWVADGDVAVQDPDGLAFLAFQKERRRRRWIVRTVLAIVATLVLVGCGALFNAAIDKDKWSGTLEVIAEMNAWQLPPSVARSGRSDVIKPALFAARGPSVTQWFDPVGVTPTEAMGDLVAALSEQGYEIERYVDQKYGDVSYDLDCDATEYCTMQIWLDLMGKGIEVRAQL